ncbi:MAG TPA: hypothetical protein VEH82_05075 [Acidimicrobiales bacterium]|nr:hypothetical protein [Acidimicrobiales bacterium]
MTAVAPVPRPTDIRSIDADDWWPYDDELSTEDDEILRRIEAQRLEEMGLG